MTKVPVNVPGYVPNMNFTATKVQETEPKGEFEKIFENQKSANAEVKTKEAAPKDELEQPQDDVVEEVEPKEPATDEVTQPKEAEGVKETAETQTGQQQTDAEADPNSDMSAEILNLVMPVIQEAVTDIKALLAQELGITQEELGALLEEMGLTEMDLLESGTIKDIVLQFKGVDDMTALLTDEELYAQIQKLEAGFEEVMTTVKENLQVSEEEMTVLKEQLTTVVNAEEVSEEPVITVETKTPIVADGEEAKLTVDVKLPEDTANKGTAPKQDDNAGTFMAPNQNQTVFTTQNANAASQVTTAQTANFVSAETENIMNQIMDYMKIQLDAETSSLEMQLQPESLGTLQIRITAKEGIMTAQFTTASETVRAALESQMVQLQQQLENQNIKVDAIEVTVQTHQFESALEQGEERQQAEEGKKNKSRKIDLSRLDEMEEIPEEDKIVAEMMAANGNTVDYLA